MPAPLSNRLVDELRAFSGTSQYYQYQNLYLTDGVNHLAHEGHCFWLLDIIWSVYPIIAKYDFVVCALTVNEDRSTVVEMTAKPRWDAKEEVIYHQAIRYTDFPCPSLKLFIADAVVMVPSES